MLERVLCSDLQPEMILRRGMWNQAEASRCLGKGIGIQKRGWWGRGSR